MNCLAVSIAFMARFEHQDGAIAVEERSGAIEYPTLMSLDVDLDQIEPVEATLVRQCIEAAQRNLHNFLVSMSGPDPPSAGIGACRGHDWHSELRHAVVVANRAADHLCLTEAVGRQRRFERRCAARSRFDRKHS